MADQPKKKDETKDWKDMGTGERVTTVIVSIIVIGLILWGLIWVFSSIFGGDSDKDSKKSADTSSKTVASAVKKIEQHASDNGMCNYEYDLKAKDAPTTASILRNGTSNFVNIARQLADSGKCDATFSYAIMVEQKDDRGNDQTISPANFLLDKDSWKTFKTYKWDDITYKPIGQQLSNDNILSLSTRIDGVKYTDVQYQGSNDGKLF